MSNASSVYEVINKQIERQLQAALDEVEVQIVEKGLSYDENGIRLLDNCIRRSIDVDVQNGDSNRPYNGINKWSLNRDKENFYLTYNQIKKLGGSIKAGLDHDYRIIFLYVPPAFAEVIENGQKISKCIRSAITKYFRVYRFQDTEGITRKMSKIEKPNKRIETLEQFLDRIKKKGINWAEGGNETCYDDEQDVIHIPPITQFVDSHLFYATLFREVAKATGHKDKMNRWKDRQHTDDREDLMAEVVAATICLRHEVNVIPETVADIRKWMVALQGDEKLFTSAMSKAEKCIQWLDA